MDINKVSAIGEFFKFCKDNEVEFVSFRFTDIKGTWRQISFSISEVNEESFKGIPYDASSVAAWQPIDKSDMLLIPDPVRYFLDPFSADTTVVVFCDIWDIYNNAPYEKCPRSIVKRAMEFVKKENIGDVVYFGPENEFFMFDSIKIKDSINCQYYEIDTEEGEWNRDREFDGSVNIGHRSGTKGGYFAVTPIDSSNDIRAEMVKVLNQVGVEAYLQHHEVGQAQCEIGVKFGDMLEAADNIQKLKYVVKMVAHLNGKTATFMPKPIFGDNGNGMHVHISIWKGKKNLFAGDKYQGLSDISLYFLGGILKHARSIAAFTNASTNSYKRLIPGFEAPSILAYSAQNRSASVRIPYNSSEKSKRVEFRFPDSSSNPYLAFAALLMGGIDGIKNKIHPGEPMDINLFKLTLDEIRDKGIIQLPHTLRSAIEEMLADREFYKQGGVFSEEFLQTYKAYKFKAEIWPWEARPHPFEFVSTYSC